MSLYDRLVPAEALRFDRAHPMTRPWPELDLWTRANPAISERVLPEALWAAAVDPAMPPGVVEIEGHRYPLVEFMDEPTPARYHDLVAPPPDPPANPWLPWRKRR